MIGFIAAVESNVPQPCQTAKCSKDRCSVRLDGLPTDHVLIDLDCDALSIPPGSKRCDYVFVGGDEDAMWVAPIELKSGSFKGGSVAKQLQGGANAAEGWLPPGKSFRFVPVLVHGKGVHRREYKRLNESKIKMRGLTRQTKLIKCGGLLTTALAKG